MISRHEAFGLLRLAAVKWQHHNAPRLGAALAYYTLLSLAPLLILAVAITGLVFSQSQAEQDLLAQADRILGTTSAHVLHALVNSTHQTKGGLIAGLAGLVTLFFGASGVFAELRDSLNLIWDVPVREFGWRGMVGQRLFAFGMVLALGLLLLASVSLSAWLGVVTAFFGDQLPVHAVMVSELGNAFLSLTAVSIFFMLIFKFVPEAKVAWRDVAVGAIATALLFGVGRALLTLYLSTAAVGSAYGAAGSLVAFVVWVYYSAQIFFFGAIFTRVYATRYGSHSPNAVN
jgi:membrane protein